MPQGQTITIRPLTVENWADFESLMGPKGGVGGCWCMLWRQSKRDHDAGTGDCNRQKMQALAEGNQPPGLLAYDEGQVVGWLSVAPREDFPRLSGSRVLKPVDDKKVWSVSCFLIPKSHRRRGIAVALLIAACSFVRQRGGSIVEGYPIDPSKKPYTEAFAWTGFKSVYDRAGFTEILRRSETRPIMRKVLGEN